MKIGKDRDTRELSRIFSGWGIVILGGTFFLGAFVGMIINAVFVRFTDLTTLSVLLGGVLGIMAAAGFAVFEIKRNK